MSVDPSQSQRWLTIPRKMSTSYVPFNYPWTCSHPATDILYAFIVRYRHILRFLCQAACQGPCPLQNSSSIAHQAGSTWPSPNNRAWQGPPTRHRCRACPAIYQGYIIVQYLADQCQTYHHVDRSCAEDERYLRQRIVHQHSRNKINGRISYHGPRALHNLHVPRSPRGLHPCSTNYLRRCTTGWKILPLRRQC